MTAAFRPPMPRAILFDWDNTLVDTWPCIMRAINETLVTMGQAAWTEAECKARIARSLRDSFPELFGERWQEARDVFYAAFRAFHIEMLAPLPGAQALLSGLARQGVYLAVVSNKTGDFLRAEAAHLGWDRFFGALVGAGDAARDKPATDPVHLALDGSGLRAGDGVWFVGDNLVDMQCAAESGCLRVLLHPEPPDADHFGESRPHLTFAGCDDFAAHIRNLTVPIPGQR